MALVGPRPPEPGEADGHRDSQRRLLVKPGITGLHPLDGVREPSSEVTGLDLTYVKRWSPALDVRILLQTLRTALRDKVS